MKLDLGGISIKADPERLDDQKAVASLLDGRELYRATSYRSDGRIQELRAVRPEHLSALATAEPGERPYVVREHRCPPGALVAPAKPKVAQSPQPCTAGPQTGVQGASRPPFGPGAPDGPVSGGVLPPSRPSSGPLTPSRPADGPGVPDGPPGASCHRCRRISEAKDKPLTIRLDELEVWAQHEERHPRR